MIAYFTFLNMYTVEYDKHLAYYMPTVCDDCVIGYPNCSVSINKPVACHAFIWI